MIFNLQYDWVFKNTRRYENIFIRYFTGMTDVKFLLSILKYIITSKKNVAELLKFIVIKRRCKSALFKLETGFRVSRIYFPFIFIRFFIYLSFIIFWISLLKEKCQANNQELNRKKWKQILLGVFVSYETEINVEK